MQLADMLKQRMELLNYSDALIHAAKDANRENTASEKAIIASTQEQLLDLDKRVAERNSQNTLNGREVLLGGGSRPQSQAPVVLGSGEQMQPTVLSEEYGHAFIDYLTTRGTKLSAALYEGSNSGGGFIVPSIVDQQLVPLAPSEMAVRRLAKVIPTAMDIRIPIKAAFGTGVAVKPESGATTNTFPESDMTIGQFTLSSFMVGGQSTVSWELIQDVSTFQEFSVEDLLISVQMLEEGYFLTGTGTGQPQGMLGNIGAGVAATANSASALLDATVTVQGALNAVYHPGAAYLMNRATGAALKLAQKQSNLFVPAFTVDANGQERLWGYPVEYSASIPALTSGTANTPVIFGNFQSGYVIGDRGGSGISVKVLDQPKATQGQLVLLAYRRVDGRVRRSEALQPITVAAS